MKLSLNVSRIVLIILVMIVSGAGITMAAGEPAMKMPVDDACEPPYIFFEDVCILPAAAQGEPTTILQQIKAFKENPDNQTQSPGPKSNPSDDALCARYKKMLADYTSKSATTYNPDMKEIESSRGQANESGIKEAKDYLINFCND